MFARHLQKLPPKPGLDCDTTTRIVNVRAEWAIDPSRDVLASSDGANWTVCMDREVSLKEAVQSRTVFLTETPSWRDVLPLLSPKVQTVGSGLRPTRGRRGLRRSRHGGGRRPLRPPRPDEQLRVALGRQAPVEPTGPLGYIEALTRSGHADHSRHRRRRLHRQLLRPTVHRRTRRADRQFRQADLRGQSRFARACRRRPQLCLRPGRRRRPQGGRSRNGRTPAGGHRPLRRRVARRPLDRRPRRVRSHERPGDLPTARFRAAPLARASRAAARASSASSMSPPTRSTGRWGRRAASSSPARTIPARPTPPRRRPPITSPGPITAPTACRCW